MNQEPWAAPTPPEWMTGEVRVRSTLASAATRARQSAVILRAHGRASDARRAELFASRMRLAVDEPRAVRRLHAVARGFHDATHQGVLLQRALDGAITLLGAEKGNIQLHDPVRHTLTIAAEQGFSLEFLEYFAQVTGDTTACGRAAVHRMQTIIFDVNHDPAFAPHRGIASASGFRAVQSTPLVDRSGRLRGILSTHFRRPHRPTSHDLQIVDWLAELLTAALSSQQVAPALLFESTAARHEQSAQRHQAVSALLHAQADTLRSAGRTITAAQVGEWGDGAHERALQERERAMNGHRVARRTRQR